MRRRIVLLIEDRVSPEDSVSATLQNILEPDFQLHVLSPVEISDDRLVANLVDEISRCLKRMAPEVVFVSLSQSPRDQIKLLLQGIQKFYLAIVVLVDGARPTEVIDLLRTGADDFVSVPLDARNVLPRVWKLSRLMRPARARNLAKSGIRRLIGESSSFLSEVEKIPQIAQCDANVLITGETGTGKELYARAIHYCSSRAGRPFMPVNCGAIPADLVENELFGHERGAFTSAVTLQTGLVEEANGGTLFLDEVDCLPTFAQVKLLRFLQEKEYRPLGSSRMRQADVRVIAASNVNLEEAVGNGKVRQDLFYRLNIISLTLPPLRERLEDVPLLAGHFLEKYSREMNKETPELQSDALHMMMSHTWPGNVRELEHAMERASVLCTSATIRQSDLILALPSVTVGQSLQEAKATQIARFEKSYIQGLLRVCRGNISKAARLAQKNRRAFWQLIQKYKIDVDSSDPVCLSSATSRFSVDKFILP